MGKISRGARSGLNWQQFGKVSMLGKWKAQEQQSRKIQQLPHQIDMPTLKQLQKMQDETLHGTGLTVQLPFGEAPENFTVTVTRDPMRGIVHWMLYRGEGAESSLEWEQLTSDVNWVFNLIEVAMPTMTRKRTLEEDLSAAKQEQQKGTKPAEPARSQMQSNFEGDLQNMAIPNLIQSIDMNALTGRLELEHDTQTATVFFANGAVVHCATYNGEGESALLEVLSWTHGKFRFFKEDARQKRTINKPLHHLLMAGAALQDQITALRDRNITLDTYLIKKHANMDPAEFDKIVEEGTGCDESKQKQFYQLIDGAVPIFEILRRLPMPKSDWVPIVFNMVTLNLCSWKNASEVDTAASAVNWAEVQNVALALSRPDTQVYTQAAYLYFLSMEFNRYRRFKQPFATVVLNIGIKAVQDRIFPLHPEALRIVAQHIKRIARDTDFLFHFGDHGLALILPCTDLNTSKNFATHIGEILQSTPLVFNGVSYPLVASVGAASIPESCESADALITLAQPRPL